MPPKRFAPQAPAIFATIIIALFSMMAAGCQWEERVVRNGWDEWAKSMGADTTTNVSGEMSNVMLADRGVQTWGVLLDIFSGQERASQAQKLIVDLRQNTDLKDFWIKRNDGTAMVIYGAFPDRTSDEARQALATIRNLDRNGKKPYSMATMQALTGASKVADNPLDAKSYIGFYTLQIGAFNRDFGSDYKEVAEKTVEELRRQGENAFFYHGPFKSMICIDLFTDQDFEMFQSPDGFMVQGYGPRIHSTQKRFPDHMLNGKSIVEKYRGEEIGTQPSFIVRIF